MLRRFYHSLAYWASLSAFASVSLALNAVCVPLLLWPDRKRLAPVVRETIRRLFSAWTYWMKTLRLVTVTWHGVGDGPLPRPAVYVANHPSLIDATLIMARLPDAVCIFKPALLRSPFCAAAATMAGYVSGEAGTDLLRDLGKTIAGGATLLVFPEGTRTAPGAGFNNLKPGFASIARHAGVPVQVLIVRSDPAPLARGQPLWRPPQFPAKVEIHLDRLLPADPEVSNAKRLAEVQAIFAARLGPSP